MNILLTLDENYLLPCKVMLDSLFASNPAETDVTVYLLHSAIPAEKLEELASFCAALGAALRPIAVDAALFESAPTSKRYPKEMYYRLLSPLILPREVERNLWSQAEFDSVTAKKLCELRAKYWPDTVQLPPEQMGEVLRDLYSRGATIVSSEQGYGIYFRREDTLYFVEMMAENDRAAEVLMEAAREKEVIVEKAVITVGAAQNLFLGEGTRQEYGLIRFEGEPFDVSESYMRLMMD